MTIDRKTFMVVNPNSANGSTGRKWPEMQAYIEAAIGAFDWRLTSAPKEAIELTREAIIKGCDQIVAVGGDGTNNEVVNGFFDGDKQLDPECAFSFICLGTGGDFRKTFGWGTDLDDAIRRIESDAARPIDLGCFTYLDHHGLRQLSRFINITSFGISGLVDHLVNTSSKALGGRLSFMIATGRALWRYQNQEVRLSVDDRFDETLRINTVAVANGRFFGGGMMIAPEAEVDDGLFDIVILGDVKKADMVRDSSHVYKGTHLKLDYVTHLRGRKVIAESQETVLIDMDGEQPGSLPCVFELLPGVLPLKLPANREEAG